MRVTTMIGIVCDANVVLKWFHTEGEEEVDEAQALLDAHRSRAILINVLDLTAYEVGNALLRGRARAAPEQVVAVLAALAEICPVITPDAAQMRTATMIADQHNLTLYDAAYAAVAVDRDSQLATLDRQLLDAELGRRPGEIVAGLRDLPGA